MKKRYIVRWSDQERKRLQEVIKKFKGTGQRVRRAQMLLKADVEGPSWTDGRIAEAVSCRGQPVEKIRQRFVECGFQETRDGKARDRPPRRRLLTGDQEAQVIATRLGPAPTGYAKWSLRLRARKVVELEIVDAISHEAVRQVLKKTV